MTAFEIYINGRKICVAGLSEPGVLSSIVTLSKRGDDPDEMRFHAGGLISKTHTFVDWDNRPLVMGDEVRMVVCDKKRISKPKEQRTESAAVRKRRKLNALKGLAEEMGYDLQKKRR